MKRTGNLYNGIFKMENLQCAEILSQQGKAKQYGIKVYNKNRKENLEQLSRSLQEKSFRTSKYTTFTIFEPKERLIYRLPYYPDRIAQHVAMNVLKPIFLKLFTSDSYGNIDGRGVHLAGKSIKNALRDKKSTYYCLKIDIKKFYPSIDHVVLKQLLQRKIKDGDMLSFLYEIIDSAPGLPIGNYLSQYLANYYLTFFDHWLKETLKVKYYFRYVDDMVFLSSSKPYLHELLADIRQYLSIRLKLELKANYQVFPVAARGIDFLGYKFFHTHTLLRKSIKKRFARAIASHAKNETVQSYRGWCKHCNSINLLKTLNVNQFSQFGIKTVSNSLIGEKVSVDTVLNQNIIVLDFHIVKSKFPEKTKSGQCLHLQIELNGQKRVVFSGSAFLIEQIKQVPQNQFPFQTKISKENKHFQFN